MIDVVTLTGIESAQHIQEIARLRIAVFKEYPYLYDGTQDYEQEYLSNYFSSQQAVLVLAMDHGRIIGASTGMPLLQADEPFKEPFRRNGPNADSVFYFAESVLLPEYRRKGIGHRFFDARENFAAEAGFLFAAFCAVVRLVDHPSRPMNHHPHDSFWKKRGYTEQPNLVANLHWKEIEREEEISHSLVFWIKALKEENARSYYL